MSEAINHKSSHIISQYPLAIIYMLCLSILFVLWPMVGVIMAIQVALTIFWGIAIANISWQYIRKRAWDIIIAETLFPWVLWLLFGFGGILAILRVDGIVLYGEFGDHTVLLTSLYCILGTVSYFVGFRWMIKPVMGDDNREKYHFQHSKIVALLLLMLLFDWFVRLQLIRSGLYFTWVMRVGINPTVRGTNLLYHVQQTIWPIILPLLLYVISRTKYKFIMVGLLIIQMALIILGGDRSDIFFSIVILFISYLVIFHISINLKIMTIVVLGSIAFFTLLGPMIQEARILMRRDGFSLLDEPSKIPSKFILEYLPAVANLDVILNPDATSRQGLLGRIASYTSYAVSINQSIIDGAEPMGITQVKESLSIVIPRLIYRNKPQIDADRIVQEYFLIGIPGKDAYGTYLADAFAHLHVYGIVLVFLMGGIGFGFVSRHLKSNYGIVGSLMIIGLIPILQPTNDSFAQLFANIRNVLVLLIVIKIIIQLRIGSFPVKFAEPMNNNNNTVSL